MSNKVVIEAFNPYEAKYPNRVVITREELHLIKALRENGIDYEVSSAHETKLYVLSQKNFEPSLAEVLFMTIHGLAIGVLGGFIKDAISNTKQLNERLFIKNKDGEVFDYSGTPIDQSTVENVLNRMIADKNKMSTALQRTSPHSELPWAVHLEHTHEIVGWCNLFEDHYGLRCDPMKITCIDTWEKIQSGELKGFSVGGMIAKSKCNICNLDFVDCNHISGKTYNDTECICEIHQFDLAEVSVVKNPANSLANVSLIKEI
ncbi:HK97 family phage prohead protease [Vibrio cholerae]|uniref:HK97 family phage prohead protease n=1 Tax=Vibrio cholerae TaxID=666 RepID=UPI001158980E|nr:HK97 family phage prohead protease [Vibrio cholerae]TQO98042.1 hypothetical protein FLL97_16640 [Vibrio cholerae]TQP79954.1 hypothetical protein FLL74_20245 [Vibrio cholerae]